MSADDTIILVAQAASSDASQQSVVVSAASEQPVHAGDASTAVPEEHEVFPPFDPSTFTSQLVWLAIAFIVLYVVLSRAALPRIGSIIDARKARIDGDLKEADRLRRETDKAVEAYEQALAEARKDAQKIAEETRESIKADIAGKRAAVEGDLGARMSDAEARISKTKSEALANVDGIAAETAQALVSRLGESVTEAEALSAVTTAKGTV